MTPPLGGFLWSLLGAWGTRKVVPTDPDPDALSLLLLTRLAPPSLLIWICWMLLGRRLAPSRGAEASRKSNLVWRQPGWPTWLSKVTGHGAGYSAMARVFAVLRNSGKIYLDFQARILAPSAAFASRCFLPALSLLRKTNGKHRARSCQRCNGVPACCLADTIRIFRHAALSSTP